MSSFQAEKQSVTAFYTALGEAEIDDLPSVLADHLATDHLWRGVHPFDDLNGAEQIATRLWQPLHRAVSGMRRRMDIFMAGRSAAGDTDAVWVVSMGHLAGLFDAPWLGIPSTGRMVMLRYCEFHRVTDGRINETAFFIDIPHLMMQAGLHPFPSQTGAHMIQPGPATHDGLLFEAQPHSEGAKTLSIIHAMIEDIGIWRSGLWLTEELARTWHEDMVWWGPAGIGATCTIDRYARQHAAPFRAGFRDRSRTGHLSRIAEGHFGGFFGWPNFTAIPTGGFMGMPATGAIGEFRVIDIYRRSGNKLAENWVFIDLLHFWKMQGLDVLARVAGMAHVDLER